jgi:hypothetical protein
VIRLLAPLRRHITSHLPKPMLYLLSHFLGLILCACVKLIYKPANWSRLDLKLGRLLTYNDYLYYVSRLNCASLVSVVFDDQCLNWQATFPGMNLRAGFVRRTCLLP